MSTIHAQIWLIGTPACCAAHCRKPIQDPSQVIVVAHSQGNMGFCSLPCFLEVFGPPAVSTPAQETPEERDLLHALGYRHSPGESAAE
jgi:hypothetical protein